MIRAVLIAVDGTAAARSALRWAADLAQREESSGARVTASMINVWRPREMIGVDGFGLLGDEGESAAAEALLDELAGDVVVAYPRAAEIEHVVRRGFPGGEILAEARRRDVDLIVVGTRAEGPIRQTLAGSVSQWVAAGGERPVAIIPAGSETIGPPTVVGFDGSSGSVEALKWSVENCSGPIRVVTVAQPGLRGDSCWPDDPWSRIEAVFAGRRPAKIEALRVDGDPVEVLPGERFGAHQVVVGARSSPVFDDSVWGSVTTHLVAHAAKPIIVVPPHPSPDRAVATGSLASESSFGQV